jgi:DNA-binding NtrC family response regulator
VSAASILIVEADFLVRNALSEFLRECGYRVLEAIDVAEALQILAPQTHDIDVVLADVNAPEVNGFALARWVRDNRRHIQVILAGTIAGAATKAGELCEDGPALAKPHDHQILLDHIRRVLATRERQRRDD